MTPTARKPIEINRLINIPVIRKSMCKMIPMYFIFSHPQRPIAL